MRVCILTSSYESSTSPFSEVDLPLDPSRWLPEHSLEHHQLHKASAARSVKRLAREGFDVFINLCDGAYYEDRAGIEVVHELERTHQAFTGAGSGFFEPTREALKQVCHSIGVGTPRYVLAERSEDIARAATRLEFPLIVKPVDGYGSIGIYRESLVETREALAEQVERTLTAFGAALIEEFIAGREFSVLVSEGGIDAKQPRIYPPIEVGFPPGDTFLHFDLKWRDHKNTSARAVTDAALAAQLGALVGPVFSGLGGSGYCRFDVRMDARGRLFVLDINPNCSIFYPAENFGPADESLLLDPGGHRGFLQHILDCALHRQQRDRPLFKVAYDPESGHGLVATRDIAAGERVRVREQGPHHLVSRSAAEREWDEQRLEWFRRYAQPVSDEVFITWTDHPDGWFPVNHSCDPSIWFVGLDWVARRPIRQGEAITYDYTTCGNTLEPFACNCGSIECRGIVGPMDHLAPWVQERYGDHVTDYVRRAQAKT